MLERNYMEFSDKTGEGWEVSEVDEFKDLCHDKEKLGESKALHFQSRDGAKNRRLDYGENWRSCNLQELLDESDEI